jgi:hypothetical protein
MLGAEKNVENVIEIVDNMINNVKNIIPTITDEQTLEMVLYVTLEVRTATPMYIGNLNPKWELWENVRLDIQNRLIQLRKK